MAAELLDRVAARIAVPRAAEADSFVLHAPLEVLARIRLLGMAAAPDQAAIEDRICRVADTYESWGPAIPTTPGDEADEAATPDSPGTDDPVVLAADLVQAIDAGDLDGTDAAARALVARVEPESLPRLLAEPLAPRLGAAAHAPIFLHLLPRTTR
ncbi:MAG TPA: hypothetical protein VJM33_03140, partial [Microthrixaceae bacterium]|nr:hypothetical protein [Microthrixaceae bacterium]